MTRAQLAVAGALSILAVGIVDVLVGNRIGLALLYVVPILAFAYAASVRLGIALAGFATGLWLTGALRSDQPPELWISLCNAASRFALFALVAVLAASWRRERLRLAEAAAELERLLALERNLARTDALTGLPNGRAFHELLDAELARAARTGKPICLAYLDLDDFKLINDRAGHAAGDQALREIANALRSTIRVGDVPARLAGDELAVLLSDADADSAAAAARRIVKTLRSTKVPGSGLPVRVSVGLAIFTRPPVSANKALQIADAVMYRAKACGKNQLAIKLVGESRPDVASSAVPWSPGANENDRSGKVYMQ